MFTAAYRAPALEGFAAYSPSPSHSGRCGVPAWRRRRAPAAPGVGCFAFCAATWRGGGAEAPAYTTRQLQTKQTCLFLTIHSSNGMDVCGGMVDDVWSMTG